MKHLKLFEEFEPMLSPEVANLDPISLDKKKVDLENINKHKADSEWIKAHPLNGVEFYNKAAIPKYTHWNLKDDKSYMYSISFDEGYISVYSDKPNHILCDCHNIGHKIEGKDELISWIHSNMLYHQIQPVLREKILKEIVNELKNR